MHQVSFILDVKKSEFVHDLMRKTFSMIPRDLEVIREWALSAPGKPIAKIFNNDNAQRSFSETLSHCFHLLIVVGTCSPQIVQPTFKIAKRFGCAGPTV